MSKKQIIAIALIGAILLGAAYYFLYIPYSRKKAAIDAANQKALDDAAFQGQLQRTTTLLSSNTNTISDALTALEAVEKQTQGAIQGAKFYTR